LATSPFYGEDGEVAKLRGNVCNGFWAYRHSPLILLLLLLGQPLQKWPKGSVVPNLTRMKFGTIVLPVNTHRLTESQFGYDVIHLRQRTWRHFT